MKILIPFAVAIFFCTASFGQNKDKIESFKSLLLLKN
jgi:hypothetical protein